MRIVHEGGGSRALVELGARFGTRRRATLAGVALDGSVWSEAIAGAPPPWLDGAGSKAYVEAAGGRALVMRPEVEAVDVADWHEAIREAMLRGGGFVLPEGAELEVISPACEALASRDPGRSGEVAGGGLGRPLHGPELEPRTFQSRTAALAAHGSAAVHPARRGDARHCEAGGRPMSTVLIDEVLARVEAEARASVQSLPEDEASLVMTHVGVALDALRCDTAGPDGECSVCGEAYAVHEIFCEMCLERLQRWVEISRHSEHRAARWRSRSPSACSPSARAAEVSVNEAAARPRAIDPARGGGRP